MKRRLTKLVKFLIKKFDLKIDSKKKVIHSVSLNENVLDRVRMRHQVHYTQTSNDLDYINQKEGVRIYTTSEMMFKNEAKSFFRRAEKFADLDLTFVMEPNQPMFFLLERKQREQLLKLSYPPQKINDLDEELFTDNLIKYIRSFKVPFQITFIFKIDFLVKDIVSNKIVM